MNRTSRWIAKKKPTTINWKKGSLKKIPFLKFVYCSIYELQYCYKQNIHIPDIKFWTRTRSGGKMVYGKTRW